MVYALFWFDVEDCTVTQSDDAAKRLALILESHGVRGTFKVVGQKARVLEQRIRYDVIDTLCRHDIGFHSNWHGLRPQIAEYLGPLGWDEGVAEFEKREGPGLEDVRRLFGVNPVTYGQPGSNWAPQVFPVLRQWGIATYVSGFGYIGLDCQPFWLGGILCTSHMYGKRRNGQEQRHLMGLNFELGKPGELEKHKAEFSRSLEQLSRTGGLISIANHPCTLVLEQWFSTDLKPRELTEAGYQHFDEFVRWVLSHENVRTTCASELCSLYPDRAAGRSFSRDEVRALAANLAGEANFQRLDDVTVSAAEAFGMLVEYLGECVATGGLPEGVVCRPVFNPTSRPQGIATGITIAWEEFRRSLPRVRTLVNLRQAVPESVAFREGVVAPADYLAAVARVLLRLFDGDGPPESVPIEPVPCAFEAYVDEAAARSGWRGAMLPSGFEAPGLVDLARLLAWTLKPAVLQPAA